MATVLSFVLGFGGVLLAVPKAHGARDRTQVMTVTTLDPYPAVPPGNSSLEMAHLASLEHSSVNQGSPGYGGMVPELKVGRECI